MYNNVWFAYNDKASHGIGNARGGVLFSGSYQLPNIQMNTTGTTDENNASWRSFYNVIGQTNLLMSNINKFAGPGVSANIRQHAVERTCLSGVYCQSSPYAVRQRNP